MLWFGVLLLACGDGGATDDSSDTDGGLDTGSSVDDTASVIPLPSDTGPTTTDPSVTDEIPQGSSTEVDVLFVIDHSCSMQAYQQDLVTNFPVFADYFLGSGTDYHLGVISMDLDNAAHSGQLREVAGLRWVDADTPDPVVVFGQMASLGTAGSGIEQGLGATYTALELLGADYNAGFLRPGSALHIVVLSDENDQTRSSLITQSEFVTWLSGLAASRPAVTFSAIVKPSGIDAGTAYLEVSQQIGGVTWDIDDDDYGQVLDTLGLNVSGLTSTFCLSQTPDLATLDLTVEHDSAVFQFELDVDYTYDAVNDCVTFLEYVPPPGSTVVVHYLPA